MKIDVCLTGDVMTGRGVDQILPSASNPTLHEEYVKDARDYVSLAEGVNGRIDVPVAWDYVWGDALPLMQKADARVINLETSVTTSDDRWPDKGIHYRMHPGNLECLRSAGIDCCVLANNHVLDWGVAGLAETLETLGEAGIRSAGAGLDREGARAPAVLPFPDGRRLLVFAWGSGFSGIPEAWRAGADRPGINLLEDLSGETIGRISSLVSMHRRPGDLVVISLHWGPNWGYQVPEGRVRFAHGLIDSGCADLVHGHSTHHPIGIERYRGKLILYGCGDFLNDYEGISGHDSFRPDLALLYRVTIPERSEAEWELRMTPLQIRRMRLNHASTTDAQWLAATLTRASASFETRISFAEGNELVA